MLKKNKTADAAKKLPSKKPAVKRITAKKQIPAAPAVFPTAAISAPTGKKYITINEPDPQLQKKYQLILIIVSLAIIFLAVSWFFSLRYNVAETIASFRSEQMKTGIDNLLSRFKNDNNETGINQADLAVIREEIIKKINDGISSSTWPVHQSEILGLTISYPSNWNKQEITDTLTLSSYPLSAAAPSVFGQIKIKKLFKKKNSLADYLTAEQKDGYQIDPSLTQLAGVPAIKYAKPNTGADISWIVIAGTGDKIFKLDLFSRNGQGLYERLFGEMLSTIKF
jgi:hypothetical protein